MEFKRSMQEQFASVPVMPSPTEEWRLVYFIELFDLKQGELLFVSSSGQLRNDLPVAVEGVIAYCLTAGIYGGAEPIDYGTLMIQPNGENWDFPRHYKPWNIAFPYRVAQDMPVGYVQVKVRTRCNAAPSGSQVSILQGYGGLTVVRMGMCTE